MVKIEIPLIFEPLLIKTTDPEGILERKRYEISLKMAEAILYSIKKKKKKIMFAEIMVPGDENVISMTVNEEDYIQSLDDIMPTLIKYEEYEWCAKIMEAKEKFKRPNSR